MIVLNLFYQGKNFIIEEIEYISAVPVCRGAELVFETDGDVEKIINFLERK